MVIFLAENLKTPLNRASHLTSQTHYGLSPNPYTSRKSKHARQGVTPLCVCSFSVGFQFGVMRLASLAVMSLHSKRYDIIALLTYSLGVAQS